jgi:FkbH-like protein
MRLRLEDFAAFHANWEDKATNIRRIADDLSLGLDSFVFLDDNPVEREWIRQHLPEVTVIDCGSRPWEMLSALRRCRYFEAVTVTQEDLDRHALYQSASTRRQLERQVGSVEEFLTQLEMFAEHGSVDEATLPRVAQLVNKTNQFNLTTRRHNESQIRMMAASPQWWCHWFRLKDRFADHGLIGALFARTATPGDHTEWIIDTWLMSCRVLGRRMEHYMLRTLIQTLQAKGALRIIGEYIPTPKNGLVQELFRQMSFLPLDDGPNRFVADLKHGYRPPLCPWIAAAGGQRHVAAHTEA